MPRRLPLFITLLLICCTTAAQQNLCGITGKVVVGENSPLPYASVYIQQEDSIITGTLTGDNGQFEMEVSQSPKQYQLVVTYMGYKTKYIDFKADTSSITLGKIVLEPTSQALEGVTVSAEKSRTIVSGERTVITPTDPTDLMGGSVADVLRSQPSVTVDPDGNVALRGNSNVLLLIDGVPTNLGSIHAIPSSNVGSIEIITNPNATYDAEGTGGIINIVTKKGWRKGLTGMVAANYGFNHFVNGNIALNYTGQKFALRFSYHVKYEDEVNNGWLYRYYRESGDSLS